MWVGRLTCSPADALRARPAICGLWVVRTFGKPGKPRVDDRTVISGILHVLKTGCRWRDVPPAFGPPTTIYNRYNRWSQRRIWQRIFEKRAAAGPVPDELSIASSHVKADRPAAGSKRGSSRKRLAVRAAEERAKSMLWPVI